MGMQKNHLSGPVKDSLGGLIKKTLAGISASHALASPVRVLASPSGIASQERWVSWLFPSQER